MAKVLVLEDKHYEVLREMVQYAVELSQSITSNAYEQREVYQQVQEKVNKPVQ